MHTGRVQVAGVDVVEGGNVGAALNSSVPAQRQNAATWAPNIAQQQLQDAGSADQLHPAGVLRPAHRVADGAGLIGATVGQQRLRHLEKRLPWCAAYLLDQLRRVPGIMSLED